MKNHEFNGKGTMITYQGNKKLQLVVESDNKKLLDSIVNNQRMLRILNIREVNEMKIILNFTNSSDVDRCHDWIEDKM